MQQQIVTFQQMFPHIQDGGLYMCEDCHTSYLEDHGGGFRKSDTFIEFTKNLIDELNAFHTRGALPVNYNTVNMNGIHFYDSIVVIEKKFRKLNPFAMQI